MFLPGLEIVTDTVANATKTFNLATKNSRVVATLATMFPLQLKNKGEEQFHKSRFCFSAKRKCKLSLTTFLKKLALRLFETTLQRLLYGDRRRNILLKGR